MDIAQGSLRRRPVVLASIAALAVGGLVAAGIETAASAPVKSTGTSEAAFASEPAEVTLITGDRITLTGVPGGEQHDIAVEPAGRPDRVEPSFMTQAGPDGVYVLPSDAMPAIQSGLLDRELFNVSYLAENGYTDAESDQLPVIVTYPESAGRERSAAPDAEQLSDRADQLPASSDIIGLTSINGAGVTVDKQSAGRFWQRLRGDEAGAGRPVLTSLGEGVGKVWLDRKLEVTLDESAQLIGAPDAWAAGYDGSGTTVAVLDTGIDDTHADLQERVLGARSFVGDDVVDGHGHGTHVASTIAGSGAASEGQYTGVAPGARLLVGKVCDDNGACPTSGVIAAMEWAAAEQDADVVSMSLGGCCTDGTDPQSQAVNNLTASTGALFVIAAGNSGPGAETISTPGAADAALTVAATDKSDQLASFSSRGPRLGDLALKPDIAAPGVSIVAARSATGTDMGGNATPVGEHYLRANGTSMATPHVSAAAAILVQQHPDWDAPQLKAALMSTATDAGYTAYEQGAGRVDVRRAVSQQVYAATANADFGVVEVAEDDDPEPTSKDVTYLNLGDEPATLALTPSLATIGGDPVSEGALTTDATVTVPAGGTATITVTLDLSGLDLGRYTGAVVASDDAAGVRLTTPIGLVVAPPTVDLTVRTLGLDGEPVSPWGQDTINVDGPSGLAQGVQLVGEGITLIRVPAGTYSVLQAVDWIDDDSRQNTAFLFNPEVEVTTDTEITLDLRDAERVRFTTPEPSEPLNNNSEMGYQRTTADGVPFASQVGGNAFVREQRMWATPTEPVTIGEFRFSTQWTLGHPAVEMSVREPAERALHPAAPARHTFSDGRTSQDNGHPEFIPFTGTQDLPLVDVGLGLPDDLAGLDVDGKLALMEAPPQEDISGRPVCGVDIDRIRAVRDAGAAGLAIFPSPGSISQGCTIPIRIWQERFTGAPRPVGIANAFLPTQEGLALREQLADEPVTVRVEGTPETPHSYVFKPYEEGRIPDSLHYTFTHDELARFDRNLHAADGQPTRFRDYHWMWKQDDLLLTATDIDSTGYSLSAGPRSRPEHVGPLSPDVLHVHSSDAVIPGGHHGTRYSSPEVFDRPVHIRDQRHVEPRTPGAVTASDAAFALTDAESPAFRLTTFCAVCREGDTLVPLFYMVTGGLENQQHDNGSPGTPSEEGWSNFDLRLYKDGEEIPRSQFVIWPTFPDLPAEPGAYQLTAQGPKTDATWTFSSSAPAEDTQHPAYGCFGSTLFGWPKEPCNPAPLVFVSYDLADSLAMDNTVAAPGRHHFGVRAYHQPTATPMPDIAGMRLWSSTDGGERWKPVPVTRLDDGTYLARAAHSAPSQTGGAVSLKVEAWDTDGNRIEQITREAFQLRDKHESTARGVRAE